MADNSPNQNKGPNNFGRNLVQYIQNRLPYSSQDDDALNDKYKYFAKNGTPESRSFS